MDLFEITGTAMIIALFVATIFSINTFKLQKHKGISLLVLLAFTVESIGEFIYWASLENVRLLVSYHIIEFWIIIWVFLSFTSSENFKKICVGTGVLYSMVFLVDGFFITEFGTLNGPTNYFNGFLLIFLSLLYFVEVFRSVSVIDILRSPAYFFVASILIYRSTSFVVYLMFTPLMEATDYDIYCFQHLGSIFRYVLLIFAMKWNQVPTSLRTSSS